MLEKEAERGKLLLDKLLLCLSLLGAVLGRKECLLL